MKKLIEAELNLHAIKLRQMGGKVTEINTKICYVKFNVSGVEVAYAYNVNKKGRYFLERIKPYPLPFKEYDNIKTFIEINRKLHLIMEKYEDLFLYYNVPTEENKLIVDKLNEIEDEIEKTKQTATRVYHRKDPDTL